MVDLSAIFTLALPDYASVHYNNYRIIIAITITSFSVIFSCNIIAITITSFFIFSCNAVHGMCDSAGAVS